MMPELESGLIALSSTDGVLEITLNRGDKHNALTEAMYQELVAALDYAQDSDEVRVVLVRGEGPSFCAGNDLVDFFNAKPGHVGGAAPLIRTLLRFPKVIVAAVQGNAVGLGTTMLLHIDLVVAADNARLMTPFVDLGAVPEAGSSKLLPAWLGYQRAARMLLLGEPLSAAEAYQAGLVSKLVSVDELAEAGREIAARLAAKPPLALRESKRLMRMAINRDLEDVVEEDLALFGEMLQGDEARAALAARLKR